MILNRYGIWGDWRLSLPLPSHSLCWPPVTRRHSLRSTGSPASYVSESRRRRPSSSSADRPGVRTRSTTRMLPEPIMFLPLTVCLFGLSPLALSCSLRPAMTDLLLLFVSLIAGTCGTWYGLELRLLCVKRRLSFKCHLYTIY